MNILTFSVSDENFTKTIEIDALDCHLMDLEENIIESVNLLMKGLGGKNAYEFYLSSEERYQFLLCEAATRYVESFSKKHVFNDKLTVKLVNFSRKQPYLNIVFLPTIKKDSLMDTTLNVLFEKEFNLPTYRILTNATRSNAISIKSKS